jgi:signal transduction histidine kinase
VNHRAAAWLAWSMCALSLALTALSLLLLALNFSHPNTHIYDYWLENTVLPVSFSILGAVIVPRLPTNPLGWLFCAAGFVSAVVHFSAQYAIYALLAQPSSLPAGEALAWLASWIWILYIGLIGLLLLLFPTGRLLSSRWRWLVWLTMVVVLMAMISAAFSSGAVDGLGPIQNPLGIEGMDNVYEALSSFMFPLLFVAAASSLFVRLRRALGVERQQIKWFAYAAATFALGIIPAYMIPLAIDTSLWFERAGLAIFVAGLAGIPISMGIAILRYRLYDIDLIINRTLVYGALTASVVGLYVLVVGYLGALFQTDDLLVSLLATGLIAVLFAPLRDRLQRAVNRLMYGERDDPYAVVSRLGERLEATLAPEAVLPTITETVREALKLPYAAITLTENGAAPRIAASVGKPVEKPLRLPLTYQSEPVGELLLGPRAPGETFGPADRRLLEGLARQAGVAAYAVRLTTDLQRSRERLVAAREEERRRLRRDLHDGLGAQLAGLNVQAGTLRRLIGRDPAAADELVVELREELRGAIADIRRLVYDLRPPALDDLGLVAALHQLAERYGAEGEQLRVSVEAPDDLPHLPAAVEVAIYRIAQEALTNVVRHARAQKCVVRLAVDEDVTLEIVDNGVGIPAERTAGVGLSSMYERTAELGGRCVVEPASKSGTRVLVRLPLPKE